MTENHKADLPRRHFLKWSVGTIGGVMGLGYLGLAGDYLQPPVEAAQPLEKVGSVGDFVEGVPKMVVYQSNGVQDGVWVTNMGAKGWLALDFHCAHLNCPVNWSSATNTYVCPCHGGVYDIYGNVVAGPPPHGLNHRILKIQGNYVLVGGMLS